MDDHRVSIVRWHVDRYDRLRALTASRAAILLSADGLVLATIALLTPLYLQAPVLGGRVVVIVLSIAAVGLLALVSGSVSFALGALINVRPSRSLYADDVPRSMIYGHSDTLRTLRSFAAYREYFLNTFEQEEFDHALSALWSGINAHSFRFKRLRWAAWLLYVTVVGLAVFAAAVIILRVLV